MFSKIWLITGAASGIGRAVTEYLLANDDKVVATDLRLEGLSSLRDRYAPDKLLVHKLDVSALTDVVSAFEAAKEAFGRVDIVLSNAGCTVSGELEGIPMQEGRKIFDVNFWGSVQVCLEAMKFFREVNGSEVGGRLIVTSSFAGIATIPIAGYYSASKHALEGAIETLASEIDSSHLPHPYPLQPNVPKITMIEPGVFKTGVVAASQTFPLHPAYSNPTLPVHSIRSQFTTDTGADPNTLAKQICKLGRMPNPPLRMPLGLDAITIIKDQICKIGKSMEENESWSQEMAADN